VLISSRAGSIPPITSTTRSMSGSVTTDIASRVRTPSASVDAAVARHVAHRDPGDLEPQARSGDDRVGLALDERHQRTTHVAAAEQADPDGSHVVRHGRQANAPSRSTP
jgi:hypothetical protein